MDLQNVSILQYIALKTETAPGLRGLCYDLHVALTHTDTNMSTHCQFRFHPFLPPVTSALFYPAYGPEQ